MKKNFDPISKIQTSATLGYEINKIHKEIYTESSICQSNASNSLHIKEVQLCEAYFLDPKKKIRLVANDTSRAESFSSSKSSNPVERSNDFEIDEYL